MCCLCLPYFTNYDLIWGHTLNRCHQLWIMKQIWLFYLCPTKISYIRYWSFGEILICKNQKLRIVLRRKSAMKSMPTLLIQIHICFSSFTLLNFVNHALTQMRWGVPYTYGYMYQLILYMIFILLLFFFVFPDFLKTKITYVTMSFT